MEDLEQLLDRPEGLGWDASERLIGMLTAIDATGDPELGRAVPAVLANRPRAVIRLDEVARHVRWWRSEDHVPAGVADVAGRLDAGTASPLGIALASTHGDGRIRERAVAEMVSRPTPDLVPFLVLRTADWVHEVRTRARAGLALLLHDDPGRNLPAALGVALRIEGWYRGSFANAQLVAAASLLPHDRLASLLESPDREVRRFAYSAGTWRLDELVSLASSDPDVRLRSSAAEAAAREAVWTNRVPVLRRMASSRHAEVRLQALTALARLGHDADVVAHLDDRSGMVRASARAAALRLGVDPVAHYRSLVTPGAVDGLAEVGGAADAEHLAGLLAHPSAPIRSRAVRALRVLGQVPDDRVLPLLRDPSSAVVREAAAALREVPPDLPWELLGDDRVVLRRAGYSLTRRLGTVARLRAALTAVVDPDPRLARRGAADAGRIAHGLQPRGWRMRRAATLELDADEAAALRTLLDRAAPLLNEHTVWSVRTHLDNTHLDNTHLGNTHSG